MFYDNKVCDGCSEIMHDGEDIVVCPECGTPQHRECYNKNNACVNAHLHAEGFDWSAVNVTPEPVSEPEKPDVQENTQAEQTETQGNPFFTNVQGDMSGIPMPDFTVNNIFVNGQNFSADEDIGGATVSDIVTYTQVNSHHYLRKFIRNKDKSSFFPSWNWGALIFGPAWFFYRKLYKAGAIFLALSTALSLVLSPYLTPIINSIYESLETAISMDDYKKLLLYSAPMIAVNVIFTVIADYLYRKKMSDDIKIAKEATSDPKVLKFSLIRRGGVSLLAGLVAYFAASNLPTIIMYIISYF